MRSPAELTEAFRAQGLKITPQRQAIFRILHDNEAHPTAEAVHARVVTELPAVSLRTVYQTLNDLAAMRELQALDLGTGATRFDPNTGDHHHLVCEHCGLVVDIALDVSAIATERIAADHGFTARATLVVVRGTCDACSSVHPDHHHHQGEHHHG
jgi:Fe2+ or Zn2+ uptake regulation protein